MCALSLPPLLDFHKLKIYMRQFLCINSLSKHIRELSCIKDYAINEITLFLKKLFQAAR